MTYIEKTGLKARDWKEAIKIKRAYKKGYEAGFSAGQTSSNAYLAEKNKKRK